MLPAQEPLKSLVGSRQLKGTGEMLSFPDNPGHCSLGRPGQIYENTYSPRLSARGFLWPEGPGRQMPALRLPGGNRFLCNRNTPLSGKNVKSFLSPDGIQHPKGYARPLGRGGEEGASALPVIQLVRRKVGPGGGRRREEGRRSGKRLFLWEQPIRLA